MIETLLYMATGACGLPVVVFFCVKFGTYGFLAGRRSFDRNNTKVKDV